MVSNVRIRGGDGASGDGDVFGIAGDPSGPLGGALCFSCVVVEASARIVFTAPIDANASSDETDAAPRGNAAAGGAKTSSAVSLGGCATRTGGGGAGSAVGGGGGIAGAGCGAPIVSLGTSGVASAPPNI